MKKNRYKSRKLNESARKPPVHIKVINEDKHFAHESEQSEHGMFDSEPPRPFSEQFEIIEKDSRLTLSLDTYVQMIVGNGLKIRAEKKKVEKKLHEWFDDIEMEDRVEDGLYSFIGGGNLFIEVEPKMHSDFIEIPIATMVGITRNRKGEIKTYHQRVNNRDKILKPDNIEHFKFTNTRQELWGRGMFHSIINDYQDPNTGVIYQAPIFAIKDIEDGLGKIIKNYASPIQMFYFKDAGPSFIEKQGEVLKDARPGAKILTDKEFDVKSFEVKGDSKFDKYIEHWQKNIIEPGIQLPMGFFNADFTARASSETSDSILIRKVKRIARRFANEWKDRIVFPYISKMLSGTKKEDFEIFFEFNDKLGLDIISMITLYRDNAIRRSEIRKALIQKTDLPIDMSDMEDLPPITSVTPTDKLQGNNPDDEVEPKPIPQRDKTKIEIEEAKKDCMEECLRKKKAAGITIDDKAIAICMSECDKKNTSNLESRDTD